MKLDYALDDGKTYAVSFGGVRFVGLVEFVPDLFLIRFGDLAACVTYVNANARDAFVDAYLHKTALRCELDGIVEQVDPDLLEKLLVGGDGIFLEIDA